MINKRLYFYALLLLSVFSYAALSTNLLATNVERVSLSDQTGAEADRSSSHASQSADGRYVVFESDSTNLIAGSNPKLKSIYLRDRQTGLTELISVDSNEVQANAESFAPVVSSDGRYVAFHSISNTLVTGDTNMRSDVFLRDRTLGTTTRISVDSLGNQAGGESTYPSISEDGNLITFISHASDLVAGDTNNKADVFLYNRTTGVTTRISVDSSGTEGDDESTEAQISGNGQFVAFSSESTNLVASDTNACRDIFLYEISTGNTSILSTHTNGTFGDRASSQPKISSNGLVVAFSSRAGNLVDTDSNGFRDVFVRDRQSSTTERVSLTSLGNQVIGNSVDPDISEDGRFVTFSSFSKDYDVNDNNGVTDVFVHDRTANKTILISQNSSSEPGNEESLHPRISNNGSLISFESYSDNLVTGDTNNHKDIFIAENELYKSVVSVTALSATTDEESASTVQFRFQRVDNLDRAITVHFTHTGTALPGTDYVDPGTTIDFPVNVDEVFLDVTVINDIEVENTESIQITLSETIDYVKGTNSVAETEVTDTDLFEIQVSSTTPKMFEEEEVSGEVTFTRSGGTLGELTVLYSVGGNATNGTDYAALPLQILIPDGQTSQTILINPADDTIAESNESFELTVANGSGYTIGSQSTVNITLVDNDVTEVSVSALDSIATEKSTPENAIFEVKREVAGSDALTVLYTLRGTAINGVDYASLPESVTIPANQLTAQVVIQPIDDNVREPSETVVLEVLPGPFYKTSGSSSTSSIVIFDEEDLPEVSIESTDEEGNEGGDGLTFTITRTGDTSSILQVEYSIAGSALNGTDYSTISDTVTISSGQTSQTVTISPLEDSIVEDSESVILAIKSSQNYVISQSQRKATGVILDNETSLVGIRTKNAVAHEANGQTAAFEVYRKGDVSQALNVSLNISGSATNTTDYETIASQVTIPANQVSVEVPVVPLSDTEKFEGQETVVLEVSSGTGYNIGEYKKARVVVLDETSRVKNGSVESDGDSRDSDVQEAVITFSSKATNLISSDANSKEDVFWLNVATGELKRIQKTGVEPNGASIKPRLSPDGRYIVFESKATNLIDGDVVDSHSDIFLFDTTTQNIEKVVGFLSSAPNQNSHTPTVSRDGKHVLFASEATNLVAGDTNGVSDLFLVNRAGQSIQRVSLGSGGGQLNGASQNGMIDDFGNKIVFESFSNLQGGVEIQSQVFFFDALTNATSLLSQKEGNLGDGHSINAKLSSGGRVVIFESEAKNLSLGGRNRFKNIFSYDLQSQEVKLISATDQGLNLNANSFGASISGNGRYVSYITRATNLSSDTENCVARPVVRDLLTNKQVSLYSRIGNDCKAGAISTALSFSGDSISVSSKTSDLVEGDTNNFEDVFLFGNPLRVAGLVKSSKNWSKLISQRSVK